MIMRRFSKIIAVFMLILTASLIVPETTVPYLGVENVQAATKLSKTKATLIKGQTLTLKLSGVSSSKVTWISSKTAIATVKKGIVTAKKKGTVTITAKYKNKKYTCKITVETPAISKTSTNVYVGDTVTLKMNGTTQSVSWSSSNKAVATVTSKGTVTGVSPGTAKITAKIGSNKYVCSVNVKSFLTTTNSKNITINQYSTYTFSIGLGQRNSDNTSYSIYEYFSNTNCADYGGQWNGNTLSLTLIGQTQGTTTLTIINYYNSETLTFNITVVPPTSDLADQCDVDLPIMPLDVKYLRPSGLPYSTANIINITPKFAQSSINTVDLSLGITGIKIYDWRGNTSDTWVEMTIILYDENGNVVSSKKLYKSDIIVSQQFTINATFTKLPIGKYTIKLFDYQL